MTRQRGLVLPGVGAKAARTGPAAKQAMIDIRQLQGNLKHLNLGHAWRGGQIDGLRGQFVGPCDAFDLLYKQRTQGGGGLGVRIDFGFGHGPGHCRF